MKQPPIQHRFPKEYRVWCAIRTRCTNPKQKSFQHYGARGIKRCERWDSFAVFMDDMGPRPPGGTVERRDNDGDYDPDNCRWATRLEQGRNKSNNRVLEFQGLSAPMSVWAERIGVNPWVIQCRLARGWSVERTLTQKIRWSEPRCGRRSDEEKKARQRRNWRASGENRRRRYISAIALFLLVSKKFAA